ncbi:MAG: hypothetical protein JWO42_100 [Chloroflexi bacterium]|nr:hypothetical protein [Chloroflexota bacterium]
MSDIGHPKLRYLAIVARAEYLPGSIDLKPIRQFKTLAPSREQCNLLPSQSPELLVLQWLLVTVAGVAQFSGTLLDAGYALTSRAHPRYEDQGGSQGHR